MTSRRQRVLARVLALLDLTPSRAYPANSRRETPRGSRGAPPTNYRPRRYVLSSRCLSLRDGGRRDDYGCLGLPRSVRGMSRDANLLSPHFGPNDVATPHSEVSNRANLIFHYEVAYARGTDGTLHSRDRIVSYNCLFFYLQTKVKVKRKSLRLFCGRMCSFPKE